MKEKIKNNKFILMGLDEAGNLGEVLKNKTAKKILEFLGDVNEVSEKDLSIALHIPINTVEYNLKKLIKSGLVDKTNNFFWSVKGKKIPTYKLAKKHIIIGTKKPSLSYIKSLLPVIFVSGFVGLIVRFLIGERNYFMATNERANDMVLTTPILKSADSFVGGNAQIMGSLWETLLYSYWFWFLLGILIGVSGWFIFKLIERRKNYGKIN